MSLPETTPADLARHLDALGVCPGQDIVVHSSLASFGRLEGGAEGVYAVLRRAVGPAATIAVPTYTFRLDPNAVFDPKRSPAMGMGVLSEYVRTRPEARRSWCPTHSHAAIGPKAAILRQALNTSAFGPGSDFAAFAEHGFTLVMLGCDFLAGSTYVHHVEACLNVPYRDWRTLERTVMVGGGERLARCRYYARRDRSVAENFAPVETRLFDAGAMTSAPCALGRSHLARLADVHAHTAALLAADPFAVVPRQAA